MSYTPGGSTGSSSGLTDTQLRATAISVTGPLTNTQLRATAVPVSGTFWQTTQPVSGTVGISNFPSTQAVTGSFFQATQPVSIATMPTTPVTGTFWQTTQPVSIAASVAVTGPLTDTQIRATALPVSGTFWPATQPVSGTFWQATQPVSGTFFQATQPVSIAATVTVSGPLTDTQLRASAVPMSLATLPALTTGAAVIGAVTQSGTWTVTQPAITKGVQGSTGITTQDLKDAGRVLFSAATVIGGVTCVTTEALLSLVSTRDGTAAGAATTLTVTSGKRLRITGLIASCRSTGATVLSARVALRMNPSGAAVATSPIIAIASMTQQAAALAEAGDTCALMFPDGIEFSGTMQIGLSQVCSGVAGVVYASLIGFEY